MKEERTEAENLVSPSALGLKLCSSPTR